MTPLGGTFYGAFSGRKLLKSRMKRAPPESITDSPEDDVTMISRNEFLKIFRKRNIFEIELEPEL